MLKLELNLSKHGTLNKGLGQVLSELSLLDDGTVRDRSYGFSPGPIVGSWVDTDVEGADDAIPS